MFVGSPLGKDLSVDQMAGLGKALKKNGIAIDVVSYGPDCGNFDLLHSLVQACSVTDAQGKVVEDEERVCRLVVIPPGESLPDAIKQHLLHTSSDAIMDGDEEMDPELALALKLSLEEEEARQKKSLKVDAEMDESGGEDKSDHVAEDVDDDEAMLQQAIAMSMMDQQQQQPPK